MFHFFCPYVHLFIGATSSGIYYGPGFGHLLLGWNNAKNIFHSVGRLKGKRASPVFFAILYLAIDFFLFAVLKTLQSTARTLKVSGTGASGPGTFDTEIVRLGLELVIIFHPHITTAKPYRSAGVMVSASPPLPRGFPPSGLSCVRMVPPARTARPRDVKRRLGPFLLSCYGLGFAVPQRNPGPSANGDPPRHSARCESRAGSFRPGSFLAEDQSRTRE